MVFEALSSAQLLLPLPPRLRFWQPRFLLPLWLQRLPQLTLRLLLLQMLHFHFIHALAGL